MKTVIISDSCCDLPLNYINENPSLIVLGVNILHKGKEFQDDFGKTVSYSDFYNEVRAGEMPSTSQINVQTYTEIFKKYIIEDYAIICLVFSSALSGCVNSARLAKELLVEESPNADITVIDTKSASMGEGLIVYYANEMNKKGCTKTEIVNWVEENKLKVNHWFTVNDLYHLKRGGRVTPTAAAIGTLLSIKPVLHVDNEGRLIPVSKSKGRKKSLRALVDMFEERVVNPEDQMVFISHGDCEEDAELVKQMILENPKNKVKDFKINYIGPVIGSHSGPGTVALFFIGTER